MKILKYILTALVLVILLIYGIGWYLSPQDKLQKSDAIVVISGGETTARAEEGVRLYEQSLSEQLVFSGAALEGSVSNAKSMQTVALREGVPREAITIEENARDTIENAKFTLSIVEERGIKSIILVTSPYHQRRASIIFNRIYPDHIRIINHSAKDSSWRRKAWWSSSWAFNITVSEILKIIYLELNREITG